MLACVLPSTSAPVVQQPTVDIHALDTFIAQTAGAAQTKTALVKPTITYTPTATRTPTVTPVPSATFLFIFPTFTPYLSATPIGQIPVGGGGSGSADDKSKFVTPQPWSCQVIVSKTQPPFGAVLQKEQEFYAYWTILNTGTKTWTRTTIDLVYTGGWRHEGTKIIDATENAGTGATIRVGVRFIAPKKAGEYGSHFVLKVGNTKFCGMRIEFVIK